MKNIHKTISAVAVLCLTAAASLPASAVTAAEQTKAMKSDNAAAPALGYSDRNNMKVYDSDRKALQEQLTPGMDVAFYRKKLADLGYQITAVNDRDADYVEYEVVKGANSHEVQIDFDKATKKATKVDVAMNNWRADSTKAALRGNKYKPVTSSDYSDRRYMKGWTDEKDTLEKALGTGHEKAYYAKKLADLGYKVTATNDREADYLEYEIVKGNRSYEVQIDFDKAMQKSSKVDVTTNLWQADATDKALSKAKR